MSGVFSVNFEHISHLSLIFPSVDFEHVFFLLGYSLISFVS